MKRTHWLVKPNFDEYRTFRVVRKITCQVVGEFVGGAKIWQDEDGEQYCLFRLDGVYYFVHA